MCDSNQSIKVQNILIDNLLKQQRALESEIEEAKAEHDRTTATQKHHLSRIKDECKKLKDVTQKLEGEYSDLKKEAENSFAKKEMFENRQVELQEEVFKADNDYAESVANLRELEREKHELDEQAERYRREIKKCTRTGR